MKLHFILVALLGIFFMSAISCYGQSLTTVRYYASYDWIL